MARGKKEVPEKKERIEVESGAFKLSAYWINKDSESTLMARCDLIIADSVIVKVSLMYSPKKEQAFISFPQHKSIDSNTKEEKYYNHALPATKEAAAVLTELANELADKIDE